ncbi:MAG: mechanosensitive ion channel [Oscillospiraceae bacterium]|nr:mechanosensitive ion channel [Oscillospiraceae bacterium]MBQ3049644.1 mechanosensitive ion channel [Oscillospiraceae bacterium]MBQ9939654.1 mechanosensitive ion channel [Oscillospiraceae bacterium]
MFSIVTEFVTSFGIKLLGAIVVLVVGIYLISILCKWINKSHKFDRIDSSLRSFLKSFTKIALYIILIITVAMILGVPATSFLTILASCGVAIGLALQGSLSNLAGGLMILFFKPFKIGDFIEASGESGTVVEISVVYTELLTPDNKRITVPNGTLTNSVIKNYSAEDTRRVDFTFNVAYDSNDETVKKLISEIIQAHPLSLAEPAPVVRLSAHADSSLTYSARVWCKNADYWTVYFDIMEAVKASFDKNGINIPFQQMDIHIKND